MVSMPDHAVGGMTSIPPLPPFTTPEELLAESLVMLDPPSRITVTDAAEAYMRVPVAGVWQQYDRSVVPYTVEPADITQSRRFKAVVFVGPSQSGKSKMLETVALHAPMCNPAPVQIIHMTKTDANAWVEEKLNPTIRNSPLIYERLGKSREDDAFGRKRFRGMSLTIGYPVPQQLSSRSQRMVLLTDYDHMDQRLGPKDSPEGTPFGMARQRIRTFMSGGCVLVESTPAFPVMDVTWAPKKSAPHELPPTTGGIAQIFNEGTRGRWYWSCPDCDDLFEPRFDRLHYDAGLDPMAAGDSALMVCPHCGGMTSHRHKVELNRAALAGRGGWLHEGGRGQLVGINDDDIRGTDVASYSLNGAAATFANWSDLVVAYLMAMAKLESLGDEMDLARFHYTDCGQPYKPHRSRGDSVLDVEALKQNRESTPRGVAPDWTRFVTITVDVQDTRFPVQVTAWALDGRRTIIDRFDLAAAPVDAPRAADRGLMPHKYAEDWAVLLPLADRVFPVAGQPYGLKAVALVVDFQGSPGVSDNAEKFWRARRKTTDAHRWFLSRGHGGFDQRDRVWYEAPERASHGRKARGIKLLNMATDRLKDTVVAALGRPLEVAGSFPLPEWLDDSHIEEFTAEERTAKKWEKRKGMVRNESLDLSVQAQAVAEHKGLRRINPEAPPDWAVGGSGNEFSVDLIVGTQAAEPQVPAKPSSDHAPIGIKFLRR